MRWNCIFAEQRQSVIKEVAKAQIVLVKVEVLLEELLFGSDIHSKYKSK